MEGQTFVIKSLYVQNTIMLVALGIVLFFLFKSVLRKKPKEIIVFLIWVFIVVWFFNSQFFGFSAVTVAREGIKVDYGILSIRNAVLPLDSKWGVESTFGGVISKEKLYHLRIAGHRSMKVTPGEGLDLLNTIGAKIEQVYRLNKACNNKEER